MSAGKAAALAGGGIALAAAALWLAPRWLVPLLAALSPGCLYFVPTAERAVALTIDDGPDERTTPRILDLLAAHRARATFFLISGRVGGREAVARAIAAGGHEVGNHLTRDEPSFRLPPPAFEAALLEADSVLSPYGPLRWARPGSGWYTPRMLEVMRRHGYRCALGSVYPYDPHIPSVRFAAAYIRTHVRPGAVIVLHDGGSQGARTARVLARVLPELARRGYRVVTLSELAALPRASPAAALGRASGAAAAGEGRPGGGRRSERRVAVLAPRRVGAPGASRGSSRTTPALVGRRTAPELIYELALVFRRVGPSVVVTADHARQVLHTVRHAAPGPPSRRRPRCRYLGPPAAWAHGRRPVEGNAPTREQGSPHLARSNVPGRGRTWAGRGRAGGRGHGLGGGGGGGASGGAGGTSKFGRRPIALGPSVHRGTRVGKGDRKTRRGKLYRGTFGKRRPRKKKKAAAAKA